MICDANSSYERARRPHVDAGLQAWPEHRCSGAPVPHANPPYPLPPGRDHECRHVVVSVVEPSDVSLFPRERCYPCPGWSREGRRLLLVPPMKTSQVAEMRPGSYAAWIATICLTADPTRAVSYPYFLQTMQTNPPTSPNCCGLCGATSYHRVVARDKSGAMKYTERLQCSGCGRECADVRDWRQGGGGGASDAAAAL